MLDYKRDSISIAYKKIEFHETKENYYLIGFNKRKNAIGVIKIDVVKNSNPHLTRLDSLLKENPMIFDIPKIEDFKRKNKLKFLFKCSGIIGFIKFLAGYYIIIISRSTTVAKIGQHKLNKIEETKTIPLFDPSLLDSNVKSLENKYKKILADFDLTLGFYFSASFDLTNSLAKNFLINMSNNQDLDTSMSGERKEELRIKEYSENFTWNYHLIYSFHLYVENKRWIMPIIHGYIEQTKLKMYANIFSITLISRRQRHHAGARYLKRGLNEKGLSANFVETEQIIMELANCTEEYPICSSFLQIRASVPTYWYQEPHLYVPKPQIQINSADPFYQGTKKHILDLIGRYGDQLYLVNLMKTVDQAPKEKMLSSEYAKAINFLKPEIPENITLKYIPFDLKTHIKRDKNEFYERCSRIGFYCIMKTGMFSIIKKFRNKERQALEFQRGVVRTNCVDCLDRTNFFQQLIGEIALGIQIAKLNRESINNIMELDPKILKTFRDMYQRHGDVLSIQYGGSITHKQTDINESHTFEFMTSIKRHFSNSFTDNYKQQTKDLFLGNFKPALKQPHIWEINNTIKFIPNIEYENIGDKKSYIEAVKEFNKQFKVPTLKKPTRFVKLESPLIISQPDPYMINPMETRIRRSHSVYSLSSLKPNQEQITTKPETNNNIVYRPPKRTLSDNMHKEHSKYRFELDQFTLTLKRKKPKKCFSYKSLERKLKKPYNSITLSSENYMKLNEGRTGDARRKKDNQKGEDDRKHKGDKARKPHEEEEFFKRYLNVSSINNLSSSGFKKKPLDEKKCKPEFDNYIEMKSEINPTEECLLMKKMLDKYEKGRSKAFESTQPVISNLNTKKTSRYTLNWGIREKNTSRLGLAEDIHGVQLLEQHIKKSFAQIQKTRVSKI